ncbi:MAG TPA: glycosyltransferase family 2 protein [Cellulomonas sp.]
MTSIVIPAHNEAAGIARLLTAVLEKASDGEFEVVVVCNGCTDRTAEVARSFGDAVIVAELAEPSKAAALKHGDRLASTFPRIYVDADVEVDAASLRALAATLDRPGIEATGPVRILDRSGVSRPARWYYDVWEHLPGVRAGLFGRGVIAVSAEGHERIRALPEVMSDDLAISEVFDPDERTITSGAQVRVRPAATWRALVSRRVRVTIGTRQLTHAGMVRSDVQTSGRDLVRVGLAHPGLALRIPFFAATAVCVRASTRRRVRRGLGDVWVRDETSRGAPGPAPDGHGERGAS